MLYGCVTWSPSKTVYGRLRGVHHKIPLRCIGWRKRNNEDHILSYAGALLSINSERIETMVRRRRLLFAGFVTRMVEERLPKRVMFGELVGGKGFSGGQEWDWMRHLEVDPKEFAHQTPRVARGSAESRPMVPTGRGKGGGLLAETA